VAPARYNRAASDQRAGWPTWAIAGGTRKALRFHVQQGAGIVSNDRYNPNNKGWGVAALIIALAIIANVTAYSIHKATYLKPDKAPTTAEQGR
jgi:hypothetical protein